MKARFIALAAMALILALFAAGTVLAHAHYDHSEPADGATVAQSPAVVRAWFTEKLSPPNSYLTVVDSNNQRVDTNDSKVDSNDPTLMTISLKPNLPAGTYTVKWHSYSAEDGDQADGTFTFTVGAGAAAAAAAKPAALPTTGGDESFAVLAMVLAGLLFIGGGVLARRLRLG
ncbi:MAG: copper resistance protein CopC [Anaerolineae bacterium]